MPHTLLKTLLLSPRLAPLRVLAFIALILVISWLAFTPAPPPQANLGWDKANHAAAFATLAVVGRFAWPSLSLLRLSLMLLAYGGFIEVVQGMLPPRESSLLDLVGDAVGIALGLGLAARLFRWTR